MIDPTPVPREAADQRSIPIFVLGRHRSGTTWLSNILATLPEIYAPTHELHRGVHESAYFSQLVPYCNHGRSRADLLAIKHLFEASDFFLLTGLQDGPDIVDCGYAGYFRATMEAAARRSRARYWLEKTPAHTLQAPFLRRAFPGAVFVAVIRDPRDVVASNVHGFGRHDALRSWFVQSVVTAIYEKIIERSAATVVRYEDLVNDHERTVRSVLTRLGIEAAALPANPYGRNSSYQGVRPDTRWWQILAMATGRALVALCPAAVVERSVTTWLKLRTGTLPPWFFLIRTNTVD